MTTLGFVDAPPGTDGANTNGRFGFDTTSDEVAQAFASNIRGRTILVTGASKGGIGFETARALAHQDPAEIIIAGRSSSKLDDAESAIKSEVPRAKIRKLLVDLGSLDSVRKAGEEVNSWSDFTKLDVMINNAAIMACPFALTEDGFESQFATNHLGHFLLTALVAPKISAAGPGARVVNVSSRGHRMSDVRLEDYNFDKGDYAPFKGYGQSKTANMLFALELAKKLKAKDQHAYSVHPGGIMTNLGRHMSREMMLDMGWIDENGKTIDSDVIKWKTIPQGASTTIVAAFDPSIAAQSGAYLSDCNVAEPLQPYAKDPVTAEKLWELSEKLVGQTFSP